ncbi:NAD(P)/FAD-dependent oxidoreductase [Haloterrigena sp. H1]|uniref:FAD-dependent oxidoreductase n=1 Tax=Haloterrigena sp. H1 TaxID=2552943 RepID=UPI001BB13028|nr:FAD-dependent oxidoreductase [Haloterrigena sp. H1]
MESRPTESIADRNILIVGGGLAGLAFATYLARAGAEPTIVERRTEWGDGGYGIGLWGDGHAVLNDLDCLSAVREAATDPRTVAVRASEDGVLARLSIPPDRTLQLAVHRGDFHATLRAGIPRSWLRMDTEPTTITETSDAVAVTFDDGSTEPFDLVVGADGVHSSVREQCFTDWRVREHDTYIWSLWSREDVDIGPDMTSVLDPDSEGFVARIGDRVGFNLAARLETPPSPPARDLLRTQAETIGWKLPALLDQTDAEPFSTVFVT